MLRRYILDESQVISYDSIEFDLDLSYMEESIDILDRQVQRLRTKDIHSVNV